MPLSICTAVKTERQEFKLIGMEKETLPENGSLVRFKRKDDEAWLEGEYDSEIRMFIEIYAAEPVTHNSSDILTWEYVNEP